MPRYDYLCASCGKEYEIKHGFNDSAPACPRCSGVLTKLIRPATVTFNGKGFYSTGDDMSSEMVWNDDL